MKLWRIVSGCMVFAMFAGVQQAVAALNFQARFVGPDCYHITYVLERSGVRGIEMQLIFDGTGGANTIIEEAAGQGSLRIAGRENVTGLVPGTYIYKVRERFERVAGSIGDITQYAWNDWSVSEVGRITVDGQSAHGWPEFDVTLKNAHVKGVYLINEDVTLTLSGNLYASDSSYDVSVNVANGLVINNAVLHPFVYADPAKTPKPFTVKLLKSGLHLSGITGGKFELEADDITISDSQNLQISPPMGGRFTSVSNCVMEINQLQDGYTLEINDSDVTAGGNTKSGSLFPYVSQCSYGRMELNKVKWRERLEVCWTAAVEAYDCDFDDYVEVKDKTLVGVAKGTSFYADKCRFHFFAAVKTGNNCVDLRNSFFDAEAACAGGEANFDRCEFGGGLVLNNRSSSTVSHCRFLKPLRFRSNMDNYDTDMIRWPDATSPSPTISQNVFMGDVALQYEAMYVGTPSTPIEIGSNFYGSPAGYTYLDSTLLRGFLPLNYPARVRAASTVFNIATPLTASPLTGEREDLRVFPDFWENGHIFGQNTINHGNARMSQTYQGTRLKGRESLLSVDISCSEEELTGVRVYALWNGRKVYAEPENSRMRRDPASFTSGQLRNAHAGTFNIILPPTDQNSATAKVYVEAASITGFENVPQEDIHIFSDTATFTDPPARELVIWVVPVTVNGTFSSYGTGDPTAITQGLKRDIPDQLPIPASKVRVVQRPAYAVWSPTAFISTVGLINWVSTELALGRRVVQGIYGAPDFVVGVMPRGMIMGAEGASFVGRRHVLLVDEDHPYATLHELGHGVGLYRGTEQYDTFPPSGKMLEKATIFHTANGSGISRVQHLPGPAHPWYTMALGYYDIMGSADPAWPLAGETLDAFKSWFNSHLTSQSASTQNAAPQAPAPGIAASSITAPPGDTAATARRSNSAPPAGYRRILLTGSSKKNSYNILNNSVTLFDVSRLGIDEIPKIPSYTDELRAYDIHGNLIFSEAFLSTYGESEWSVTFDVPAATHSCRVVYKMDEAVLAECTSKGLQAVNWLAPAAGATLDATLDLAWQVQSSANTTLGDLRHLIFYRTAASDPWMLLAGPVVGNSLSGLTSMLPETSSLALRIVTSDGVNSVEKVLEGLKVAARAPVARIIAPLDGTSGQTNAIWQLSGTATCFPDDLPHSGTWSSSLQGELGQGPEINALLTNGLHTLRYTVTSAAGATSYDEVVVNVLPAGTSTDLGFAQGDLRLSAPGLEPHGLDPQLIKLNATNVLTVSVRNGGFDSSARVRLFLTRPEHGETLYATHLLELEPFEVRYLPAKFLAETAGIYALRTVIDQVTPADSNPANNERQWSFESRTVNINAYAYPSGLGRIQGGGTYVYGAEVSVQAIPNPGYYFEYWTKNQAFSPYITNEIYSGDLLLTVKATKDLKIIANFSANEPAQYAWYKLHGIEPGDGETWAALAGRITAKGTTLWQEYIADTDPNDPTAHFRITAIEAGPPPRISFEPVSTQRVYRLRYCDDLKAATWQDNVQERRAGQGPGDQLIDSKWPLAAGPMRFYDIRVELPD